MYLYQTERFLINFFLIVKIHFVKLLNQKLRLLYSKNCKSKTENLYNINILKKIEYQIITCRQCIVKISNIIIVRSKISKVIKKSLRLYCYEIILLSLSKIINNAKEFVLFVCLSTLFRETTGSNWKKNLFVLDIA